MEMSYKSPVEIKQELVEEELNGLFKEVVKIYARVDRDEMIKALLYDREQYEAGYLEGTKNSIPIEWVKVDKNRAFRNRVACSA